MSTPTLYEILEVSEDASPQEIRASHRRLMRQLHPDMPTGDPQRAALVNDAWERLSDPAERASYDQQLRYHRERGTAAPGEPDGRGPSDEWGRDATPADSETVEEEPVGQERDDEWGTVLPDLIGEGAGDPAPDRSVDDPRRRAGLNAWAQVPGGPWAMSWWARAQELGQHPEPVLGRARQRREQRAHSWLGADGQNFLHVGIVLLAYPYAIIGLNMSLKDSDLLGFFTGAAAWLLTTVFIVFSDSEWPDLSTGQESLVRFVLRALPFILPVPGLVMPVQGLYAAIRRLADPSLEGARTVPLLALAVYACLLLSMAIYARGITGLSLDAFPPWVSQLVPAELFTQHRQWGDPARSLGVDHKGTAQALTSQLLDEIAAIPGVRILHHLRPDPDSPMLVDHAVLCGKRLVIVESICLPGGAWVRSPDGLRPEHAPADPPLQLGLGPAARRFKRRFLRLKVTPLVVVHTSDGPPVRILSQHVGATAMTPRVLTPAEFAEQIGRICVQRRGRRARRRPFSELVGLMA